MKQTKVIVALLALATIFLLFFFRDESLSTLVMPMVELLKRHTVDVVIVLVVLAAIIVISTVPRVRSR